MCNFCEGKKANRISRHSKNIVYDIILGFGEAKEKKSMILHVDVQGYKVDDFISANFPIMYCPYCGKRFYKKKWFGLFKK